MVVPEELELEAELKCDTATALEEEALRLHGKGWRIQSMGKLREAESLRDEAEGLKQRARLLCQQYKGDPVRGREATEQVLAALETLREAGASRTPMYIDSLETGEWLETQHIAKLRTSIAPDFAVSVPVALSDSIDVSSFSWDDAAMRAQPDRHIRHLKEIVRLANRDFAWVEIGKDQPPLLRYGGAVTLGRDYDGTTDAAVANCSAIRAGQPERGLQLLFDVRSLVTAADVTKAQARVLLGNLLSPEERTTLVLTDLNDEWHTMWVDGRTIYHHPFASRAKAVAFIRAFLAGHYDTCEDNACQFAKRGVVDQRLVAGYVTTAGFVKAMGIREAPDIDLTGIMRKLGDDLLRQLVPCSAS